LHFEKDPAKKAELEEKYTAENLPKFIKSMEKRLEENGGQWLVGSDLTWADIALANQFSWIDSFGVEWKKRTPKLEAFQAKIYNMPNIKAWIAKRPVSAL
jgi:glutathione S-transferase